MARKRSLKEYRISPFRYYWRKYFLMDAGLDERLESIYQHNETTGYNEWYRTHSKETIKAYAKLPYTQHPFYEDLRIEEIQKQYAVAIKRTFLSVSSFSNIPKKLKEIDEFFDQKSGIINPSFIDKKGDSQNYSDERKARGRFGFVEISRDIATMPPMDRELLRAVYKLYALDQISDQDFLLLTMALVWQNGNAYIITFSHKDTLTIRKSDEQLFEDKHTISIKKDQLNALEIERLKSEFRELSALAYLGGNQAEKFYGDENAALTWYIGTFFKTSYEGAKQAVFAHIKNAYELSKNPTVKFAKELGEIYSRMHGGNEFLNENDIPGSIFAGDHNKQYGVTLGMLEENNTYLSYFGDAAIMTIAPPGSGKSQAQVIPNLFHWKGAMVVLDVKGELYEASAKYRAKHFGKVYKFDPFGTTSHCFNPFENLSTDPEILWQDAEFLADMLILPDSKMDGFWTDSARNILRGAIAAMVMENEPRNFGYILDAFASREKLQNVAYALTNTNISSMRRCGETIEDLIRSEKDNKGNTLIGIIQTANASLSKIESPTVEKITKKSDWTPQKLRAENATVYIVLRTGMVDQYAALLRIILGVHLKELLAKLPAKDAPPILFMLDEMPQLRRMKPIEDTLDLGRQYGLRLWMFAQSLGQITEHYKNAGSFISKCAVQCYMNPSAVDGTAQKISEMLGKRASIIDGRPVPLVEMTELTGPNYADKIIIFGAGSKPAVVDKAYAYKNPELKKAMDDANR